MSCVSVFAGTAYDRYGNTTGSHKTDNYGITTQYDRYGNKINNKNRDLKI